MPKLLKNILSAGIFVTCIGTSLFLWDNYNMNDKLFWPIIYRKNNVAQGFTSEPFDVRKEYSINCYGELESYIINSNGERYSILDSGEVGSFNERLAYDLEDFMNKYQDEISNIRVKVDDFLNYLKTF